jgi:hypothetical protein
VTDDHGSAGPGQDPESDEHERLWRVLAAVVGETDPVPPEVLQSGRDSFAWRTIDAELAALTYDSATEHPVVAVVRASEGPRLVTFEAPDLTVEVEVTVLGARRRLLGQLFPPQPALVTVRDHQGGTVAVEADELGRFRAEDLPAGLCSLRCQLAGTEQGAAVVTDWIVL